MSGSHAKALGALAAALLFCATATPQAATDCTNAPQGFGNAWSDRYKAWCGACCGTFSSSGPSCDSGPNWGASGGGTSSSYERYDQAIAHMNTYLRLAPDAINARVAQDKIYEWEEEVTS